uniref:Uncharacterized protein C18orf63-like n=1 Tax=Phallusia mammillata TaxID=59560 RepID=A0A6F9D8R1_9ASCI|nr:uncharacterized protein C18orf63-like [Phallusia mammillata]
MKRGQIVKITRKLSTNLDGIIFADYEAIRKYWRNQYGYRLPAEDCDVIYCSVYMKALSEHTFTYPLSCVRSHKVLHLPRCDGHNIIKTFLANMHERVDTICGSRLQVSPQMLNTTTHLTNSKQLTENFNSNICEDKSWDNIPEKPQVVPSNSTLIKYSHQKSSLQCVPGSSDVIPSTQQTMNKTNKSKLCLFSPPS